MTFIIIENEPEGLYFEHDLDVTRALGLSSSPDAKRLQHQ